jgi:ubiquinone/menaquinone biosynthesis C-methylase UbiE
VEYWDSIGVTKTFGHPVEFSWLDQLGSNARILDYGCGYGRVTGLLHEHGFESVEGVDFAPAMIAAARQRCPQLRFTVLTDPPVLPFTDGSVDAVTLFAVLTCIPADADQRRLVGELHRVLRNDGLLYVSEMCLQEDEWSRSRYERFAARYGTYGIFETDEGAVCRHHTRDWLVELLANFTIIAGRDVPVTTMNGHSAQATQVLARKS